MTPSKICGWHAVQAAIDYLPEQVRQVWLDPQRHDPRCDALQQRLAALGIPLHSADKKRLERLAQSPAHQGVVAEVLLPSMRSEHELHEALQQAMQHPLWLVLDHVQDPHNLGACLRTADAAGVRGVILPKDQAVGLTPTVCKVACGAAATVPVYQVTNLARTLRQLKEHGIWVFGADATSAQTLYQTDLTGSVAWVLGAEGKGLRRLTRETCDVLVKMPMYGQVSSLNVSVATGVVLYETLRQRAEHCGHE